MAEANVSHFLKRLTILLLFLMFIPVLQNIQAQEFKITDPSNAFPREYTILGVEIRGNQYTRDQFIINASSLTAGTTITYPGTDIADAIKRLFQVGLFSDVKVYITQRTSTGLRLLIEVTEQPRLQEYKLEGIKRSERSDLEEKIRLLPGTAITEANIAQAIKTINTFYKEKGLRFTKVTTRTEPAEIDNRSILIFEIDKGKKLEVKDVIFNGAESFSNKKLLKTIKPLKEDAWWKFFQKKVFKEEDFEEGKQNLINLYNENGFTDMRIVSDSVWVFDYDGGKKQGIKVQLNIEEGPQYKVRNIDWDGNTVYTDEQLTQALGFEKGDVFNSVKFDKNLNYDPKTSQDITSLYQNIGYLFFNVTPRVERVAEDSLDLYFDIYEDEVATIRRVSFSGNSSTHDNVVRRTLRTVPGNTYSRETIIRTVRELSTLGFFDPQNIVPDVVPIPQTKEVDVSYELDESQSTSNFEFSGGYGGRAIGAIVSARLNFNNFSLQRAMAGDFTPFPAGDGQTLSLGVQVTGTGFQNYSFGFTEPWLNGKPTSFGVNLSYNYFRRLNDENRLFSASVTIGKPLQWPDDFFNTRTTISYQLFDVSGTAAFLAAGTSSLVSVRQVLERNSLDNFISPNRGTKMNISAEIAPPLPGFTEFYKVKTEFQHHVPVIDKLVLTSQAEYGFIGNLTNRPRTEFQRFLLGGTQLQQQQTFLYDNIDLRGYPGGLRQSIAPNVDGQQVGGRLFSKYSMELRYPAISSEQLQLIPYLFFDAGNAYLTFSDFDPFSLKRSVGVGTRLFLPVLGLVDLSYGYRLDGVEGTSILPGQWEFLFNIGAPF